MGCVKLEHITKEHLNVFNPFFSVVQGKSKPVDKKRIDYFTGGVLLDGRTIESDFYRYSFQNQERDDEIKGEGNAVNYKYRMHDPRINRFFAVDPLASQYPGNSTYAFAQNRLIDGVELEGLEWADSDGVFYGGLNQKEYQEKHGSKKSEPVYSSTPPESLNKTVFKSVTAREMEDNRIALDRLILLQKLEHSPLNDFAKLGQSLQFAPEAAASVFLPEYIGARVGSYLFRASSFARKINLAERTFNVGLNYYNQSISSNGNLGFGDKNLISLGISAFSPLKMDFGTKLSVGLVSSQFSYTQERGFSGYWERSTARNTFNAVKVGLKLGLSSESTALFKNQWLNKGFVNTLDGGLGIGSKAIDEGSKNKP